MSWKYVFKIPVHVFKRCYANPTLKRNVVNPTKWLSWLWKEEYSDLSSVAYSASVFGVFLYVFTCRFIVGPDVNKLLPATFLMASVFLMLFTWCFWLMPDILHDVLWFWQPSVWHWCLGQTTNRKLSGMYWACKAPSKLKQCYGVTFILEVESAIKCTHQ